MVVSIGNNARRGGRKAAPDQEVAAGGADRACRARRSCRPAAARPAPTAGGRDRIPDVAALDLVAVDNAASSGAVVRHLASGGGIDASCVVGAEPRDQHVGERWRGRWRRPATMRIAFVASASRIMRRPRSPSGCGGEHRRRCSACEHEVTRRVYACCANSGCGRHRRRLRELRREGVDAGWCVRRHRGASAGRGDGGLRLDACCGHRIAGDDGPPRTRSVCAARSTSAARAVAIVLPSRRRR